MKIRGKHILIALFLTGIMFLASDASAVEGCDGLICCENPPNCSFYDLVKTARNIVVELLKLCLVAVSLMIAYAGYLYLTSQGDTAKISQAHSMFSKAGIGLLIVLTAFLIVEAIVVALGLDAGLMIKLIK